MSLLFTEKEIDPIVKKSAKDIFKDGPPSPPPASESAAVVPAVTASKSKKELWRNAVRMSQPPSPALVEAPIRAEPLSEPARLSRQLPTIEITLGRPSIEPDFSPKMESFSAGCRERLIPSAVAPAVSVEPESSRSAQPSTRSTPQPDESIKHLVLIVHGINGSEDTLYKNLGKARESFEQVRFLWFQNQTNSNLFHLDLINWKAAVIGVQSSLFDKITPRGSLPVESRMFINYAISDVAFYLTPTHCEMIKTLVANMLNDRVKDLKERFPDKFRNTKISIVGYSLGSVIVHDILSEEPSRLAFDVDKLFFWGSPLAAYLSVKDNAYQHGQFVLPNHKEVYNMYHPHDPVAFRIEPLFYHLDTEIADAETIPYYENDGITGAQKMKTGWFSRSVAPPPAQTQLVPKRRLDFVLQESITDSLSHHYSMLTAHHSYWASRDVALFMLRRLTGLEPEHAH